MEIRIPSFPRFPRSDDLVRSRMPGIFVLAVLSAVMPCAALNAQTTPSPTQPAVTSGTPAPVARTSGPLTLAQKSVMPGVGINDYVGAETCKLCHVPESEGLHANPHWKMELEGKKDTTGAATCEDCHGPGKAHVESGGDKTKLFQFSIAPAKESDKRCLTCHQLDGHHDNFLRSAHSEGQVGCLGCHSIHATKTPTGLLKAATPTLCYTCHTDIRGQFSRPMHHRVNEGLLKCTDCHNPHGATLDKLLRTASTGDAICTKCHTEKMGPFTFEHPPVKIEGCVACHTPHGSQNPRLLNRSNVNTICLQCHTDSTFTAPAAPSFHNQAVQYQACTVCHTSIHGSNFNPFFFK